MRLQIRLTTCLQPVKAEQKTPPLYAAPNHRHPEAVPGVVWNPSVCGRLQRPMPDPSPYLGTQAGWEAGTNPAGREWPSRKGSSPPGTHRTQVSN